MKNRHFFTLYLFVLVWFPECSFVCKSVCACTANRDTCVCVCMCILTEIVQKSIIGNAALLVSPTLPLASHQFAGLHCVTAWLLQAAIALTWAITD